MNADTVARRNDAVLLVVDVQERLSAAMEHRDRVRATTARLIRTSALVGVPIIVTRQYPKGLGDTDTMLLEAIEAAQAGGAAVAHIDKVTFDCFLEPEFEGAVSVTARKQLILTGMETHICIAQTALSAVRTGFDCHVVADACCSRDDAHHTLGLHRLRTAGVVVTTSESAMYELVGKAGTDEFRALLGIVKD